MAAELILTHQFNGDCLLCGCTPKDDTDPDHKTLPMVHQVGGDVNWGEEVNICMVCAGVIGDLIDRPHPDKVAKLQEAHEALKARYADLQREHTETKKKIDQYVKGRKAEKELQNA